MENGTRSSIVVFPFLSHTCMDAWFTTPLSRFSFSVCKSICLLKMDLNKEKKKLSEAIYFDGGEEGELNTLKNGGWLWLFAEQYTVPTCVCTYMAHYYSFLRK